MELSGHIITRLVNAAERPVMFVSAGKAHPNDRPGRELIREIYRIGLLPEQAAGPVTWGSRPGSTC